MEDTDKPDQIAELMKFVDSDSPAEFSKEFNDFLTIEFSPTYNEFTDELGVNFEIRGKEPGVIVETFSASVSFGTGADYHQGLGNGRIDLPMYRGGIFYRPVGLGAGSHRGSCVIGGFFRTQRTASQFFYFQQEFTFVIN